MGAPLFRKKHQIMKVRMSPGIEIDSNYDKPSWKKSSIYTVIDAWNNETKAYLNKASLFFFPINSSWKKFSSEKLHETKEPNDPSILILFIFV